MFKKYKVQSTQMNRMKLIFFTRTRTILNIKVVYTFDYTFVDFCFVCTILPQQGTIQRIITSNNHFDWIWFQYKQHQ